MNSIVSKLARMLTILISSVAAFLSVSSLEAADSVKGAELLLRRSKDRPTTTAMLSAARSGEQATTSTLINTYGVTLTNFNEDCSWLFVALARDHTESIVGVDRLG